MKRLLLILLILLVSSPSVISRDFDKMWREVEMYKQKDQPRSAINAAKKVLRKAEQRSDFAWKTRAQFELVQLWAGISADSMATIVERLNDGIKAVEVKNEGKHDRKLNDAKVQNMITHALLGDALNVLAQRFRANKDLAEGYRISSKEHFELSLSDWNVLANANVADYEPLMVTLGREEDTRLYNNDMLNVLAAFKLGQQGHFVGREAYELYDSLTQFYVERGNRNGALLMKIDALNSKRYLDEWGEKMSRKDFNDSLLVLARSNKDIEAGADAYVALLSSIPDYERNEKLCIVDEALKTFPNSVHRPGFELTKARLNQGVVSVSIVGNSYDPVKVEVRHFGVEDCRISFYHHGRKRMEAVRDLKLNLSENTVSDTVAFVLTPGNYRMTVESGDLKDTANVSITSMMVVYGSMPGGKSIITVVDGNSGRPKEDVSVWTRKRNSKTPWITSVTDVWGQIEMELPTVYEMEALADAGLYDIAQINYLPRWENVAEGDGVNEECRLFTDRAVYRPGQTVNVAVLVFRRNGDETTVLENKEVTLSLHDANGKEISRTVVETNEMGSAATDFTLPTEGLPGVYMVRAGNDQSVALRVEEYKRPTFKVEIATNQEGYRLADSVDFSGRAMMFSGVPLQDATVKYRVEYRNVSFWYRYAAGWSMAESGVLTTDDDGVFRLKTYLDPDKMSRNNRLLEYRITADVTSVSGETQQGECRLAVSKNTFELNAEVPAVIVAGQPYDMYVKAITLDQKEMEKECGYSIYKRTGKGEAVYKGRTKGNVTLPDKLIPGDYMIEFVSFDMVRDFVSGDERIDTVKTSAEFTLFDPRAKTMEVDQDFMYATAEEFDEAHPVDVYFMPEHEDVTLYWLLIAGDSLVDKGMNRVDGEMQCFHLDYKKEYGDGVALTLFYVKGFEVHSLTKVVTLMKPDNKLILNWKTFRDRLVPGQSETWTLSVKDSEGQPVSAEVMATMYDASLDKIAHHNWWFGLDFERKVAPVHMVYSNLSFANCRLVMKLPVFDVKRRMFAKLIDLSLLASGNNMFRELTITNGPMLASKATMRLRGTEVSSTYDSTTDDLMLEESGESVNVNEAALQLRTDFSETAFFYPHIIADKNGEASISFILPESLTEWKFMGLAHTADMKHGMIEGGTVARKDFMVVPNMPRFVRTGDNVTISSSIVNRTDSNITGEAIMTLLDAETENIVAKQNVGFSVDEGQTTSVEFIFEVSDKHPLLICQIEASGESFSDGERNYLPVLLGKQLITTTVPFFIDGAEDKNVNIESIFNNGSTTASNRKLTIEYYGDPTWLTLDALRSVAVPETVNAISLSAAFYANVAAQYIADKIPGLASVMKGNSPLEKNQELKNVLLHESPWLSEALEETSNIDKLADLFDKSKMNARRQKAEDKLRNLQNSDGSWSWFEGMEGNIHITTTVVEHIAELEKITGEKSVMHDAMLKGLEWVDKEEVKKYERIKNNKNFTNIPSESTLRYLYISSLVERDVDSAVVSMRNAYLDMMAQMVGGLTIYGRANIACALSVFGMRNVAEEFVKSLREYTVYKPEMGRYYDTDKAQYTWCDYRMPSHLAAMKAMRQQEKYFGDTQDYLNDMTLWIIQQKRTQAWGNPINTVGAVNGLFASGRFNAESEALPLFLLDDSKRVDMIEDIGNVGRAKAVIDEENYDGLTNVRTLQIKQGNQKDEKLKASKPKWGAVYGECLEEINNIVKASTMAIEIDRKFYVERNSVFVELDEGDVLKVGDKVCIRYVLNTDRDMDFVQVRAQHPACFEPTIQYSGYCWLEGSGAYVAQYDASCDYFFDELRKGTITFDQYMYVSRSGVYATGIATAQCAYSPEFSARTVSNKIIVE